ncbi:hypothetical protein [Streptomyces erythrochromogenes]|uniref:hypothetical protein n=1 Tax=Streptomyces erythrochromogenes TaxID=285574 RepID=UPI00382FE83B
MELTLVSLVPPGSGPGNVPETGSGSGPADDGRLLRLLWGAARPGERLEHISMRSGPHGVDLGLFTVATPGTSAAEAALAICRRVLALPSPFHGWHLTTGSTSPARPGAIPATTT